MPSPITVSRAVCRCLLFYFLCCLPPMLYHLSPVLSLEKPYPVPLLFSFSDGSCIVLFLGLLFQRLMACRCFWLGCNAGAMYILESLRCSVRFGARIYVIIHLISSIIRVVCTWVSTSSSSTLNMFKPGSSAPSRAAPLRASSSATVTHGCLPPDSSPPSAGRRPSDGARAAFSTGTRAR